MPINKKLKLQIIRKYGSQAEFATQTGKNESRISRVIRGREKLSHDTQAKWASDLNCRVKDIF